ncbi:MAG: hypothetical protein LBU11_08355 [Zoogloeaceae bacterium]|jgi:hypothetical protein|nr:hypothetical protein [Zoogloeaceae bacterium]
MTVKCTTTLRNAVVPALKTALDGGLILVFSGQMPAAPEDAVVNGEVVCVISKQASGEGLEFAPGANGGAISKSPDDVWSGDVGVSGTASFWRWVMPGDDGYSYSDTALRLQGTVNVAGADLNFSSTTFSEGENRSIDFCQFLLINL